MATAELKIKVPLDLDFHFEVTEEHIKAYNSTINNPPRGTMNLTAAGLRAVFDMLEKDLAETLTTEVDLST